MRRRPWIESQESALDVIRHTPQSRTTSRRVGLSPLRVQRAGSVLESSISVSARHRGGLIRIGQRPFIVRLAVVRSCLSLLSSAPTASARIGLLPGLVLSAIPRDIAQHVASARHRRRRQRVRRRPDPVRRAVQPRARRHVRILPHRLARAVPRVRSAVPRRTRDHRGLAEPRRRPLALLRTLLLRAEVLHAAPHARHQTLAAHRALVPRQTRQHRGLQRVGGRPEPVAHAHDLRAAAGVHVGPHAAFSAVARLLSAPALAAAENQRAPDRGLRPLAVRGAAVRHALGLVHRAPLRVGPALAVLRAGGVRRAGDRREGSARGFGPGVLGGAHQAD